MDKCKWNYKILGLYLRLTESDRFIILGKRQGQWRALVNFKVFRIMVTWLDKNHEYHYKPLSKYLAYKFNWL